MAQASQDNGHGVNRRRFLAYAAGGIAAFLASAMGFISVGGVLSPALKSKKAGQWVKLGNAADFQTGKPNRVDIEIALKDGWVETKQAKSVLVLKKPSGEFTVFNSRCTHLGCIVNWNSKDQEFLCPCHGGVYDKNGVVVGGPPPRHLDTLEYKLDQGELWCQYEDFSLGVPEKKPV